MVSYELCFVEKWYLYIRKGAGITLPVGSFAEHRI